MSLISKQVSLAQRSKSGKRIYSDFISNGIQRVKGLFDISRPHKRSKNLMTKTN